MAPSVAPFEALIADVNQGAVDRFAFAEKWNRPNSGPGAEFKVGQAVLHTHAPPVHRRGANCAHTQPEAQEGQPGYGCTVVHLDEAANAEPVGKAHRNLP